MRFGKAVFAEAQDLLVDLPRELLIVAVVAHAFDQSLLERLETALVFPRRHRAAQPIGLSRSEIRRDDCELHHLLLEDRHAERALQDAPHCIARIGDRLELLPAAQIRMHHSPLDRTGADDRDLDHQVVVILRLHPRQHRHLRARLDLEHADGVAVADHLVHARIFRRHVGQLEAPAIADREQIERTADRGEHAQRQHVDLEQAQRVEIVLVPFDHRALGHRRVFDGHQLRQGPSRDHEAAGVLRQMARKTLELGDQREKSLHHRTLGVEARLLHPFRERPAAIPPRH